MMYVEEILASCDRLYFASFEFCSDQEDFGYNSSDESEMAEGIDVNIINDNNNDEVFNNNNNNNLLNLNILPPTPPPLPPRRLFSPTVGPNPAAAPQKRNDPFPEMSYLMNMLQELEVQRKSPEIQLIAPIYNEGRNILDLGENIMSFTNWGFTPASPDCHSNDYFAYRNVKPHSPVIETRKMLTQQQQPQRRFNANGYSRRITGSAQRFASYTNDL